MSILDIYRPAPHIKRLPADRVDAAYKKHRWNNFVAIFLGYACYYLLRNNFIFVAPLFSTSLSKTNYGTIMCAIPLAYGFSKFIMGYVSDRCNPRYFIVTGLAVTAVVNLTIAIVPGTFLVTSVFVMYCLMFVNGWVQGMGAPPCYRIVAYWYSVKERGRIMGIWNTSHNIGCGLLATIAAVAICYFGWRGAFIIPAIISMIASVIIVAIMRDTPQAVGLMPVDEYVNEYNRCEQSNVEINVAKSNKKEAEVQMSKDMLFKYILSNKYVWFLALANAFVYLVRYGISSWITQYLKEIRGLGIGSSSMGVAVFEYSGIFGILLCGYASDKLFNGRRAPVSIVCMLIVCIGVILYWLTTSVIFTYLALAIIGMFIYGPVMLAGVQVLDIMPKNTVGTTVGLLGFFGYVMGNTAATLGFSYVLHFFKWRGGFILLICACVISILFFSLTLNIRGVQENKGNC